MDGICSAHREPEPGCHLCETEPRDILPGWDEKVAEAEASGVVTCRCGYRHYRTIDLCPLCGAPTPGLERLVDQHFPQVLDAEQARVIRWVHDNKFDRTAWTENPHGRFMVLSGPLGAITFSEATMQSLVARTAFTSARRSDSKTSEISSRRLPNRLDLALPLPWPSTFRVFDLTESAVADLLAFEAANPTA